MTHFVVIVVGDDITGQMAPYNEALQVPRYKQRLTAAEADLARQASALVSSSGEGADTHGLELDDAGLFRWTELNPQGRWDWWEVGGRWADYFRIRAGDGVARTATALKREVLGPIPIPHAVVWKGIWHQLQATPPEQPERPHDADWVLTLRRHLDELLDNLGDDERLTAVDCHT